MPFARPASGALLASTLLLSGCREAAARESPSNVLLITVEALRADHLDAYGDDLVDTPALDAFLAEALVFGSALTVTPQTSPSLASLLTSRMPRNHGVLNDGYELPASERTLAVALDEAGYRTAAFLAAAVARGPGFARGFDVFEQPARGEPEVPGEELVARALAFTAPTEAEPGPWFVWLHLGEPGAPYAPGPELERRYLPAGAQVGERLRQATYGERDLLAPDDVELMRAVYRGEVERADRCLAPLLARVRAADARTLTIFTADHGEHFCEALNYVGHAAWLFEPMLRVPLAMLRSGGALPPGVRGDPVTGLDVAPTVLGLLGLPWESRDGGLDLLAAPAPADRLIVHEAFAPQSYRDKIALRQGPWKIQEALGQNWLQVDAVTDFRRVTNVEHDPGETSTALARPDEAGAAFARLRKAHAEWARAQSDPAAARKPELDAALRASLEALAEAQGPDPGGDSDASER
jgi:arylsulfatase A-like enzyme